jgi:hypothetical protein
VLGSVYIVTNQKTRGFFLFLLKMKLCIKPVIEPLFSIEYYFLQILSTETSRSYMPIQPFFRPHAV